ncbi:MULTISPECIES: alpha/beta hydrolase family protein [Marinobacter]|uniref:alpha/beta hydrolase family protein n=1 Tax=Marinobacter TaxID=2742 RepID=UPI000DAC7038|nr:MULTISPECIES: dienelactone hydrolase family protein [Marinobacter]
MNTLKKLSYALVCALPFAASLHVSTASADFTRGPDPTEAYLEASSGPYNVDTVNVSSLVSGFGGGTIHYPTDTTGQMGAIVVIPGYVSYESSIEWWGEQLASHGFVVMTIDTITIYDQPGSRRDQIDAALDYLIDRSDSSFSAISGMVDPNRLGAVGWSMGGGGTLQLAADDRLSAAIPLAPWNSSFNDFDEIETPTLIFACENDVVAPVSSHASPFYNDIPGSTAKAFFEINNGDHFCANGGNLNNAVLSKYGVSWMKLHIDQDTRYAPFLCGPDHEDQYRISEYRGTCPY